MPQKRSVRIKASKIGERTKVFFPTRGIPIKTAKSILGYADANIKGPRRRRMKSQYFLSRGLVRLQNVGEAMVRRKIKETKKLIDKSAPSEEVQRKLNELDKVRKKRNVLIKHYLLSHAKLASRDIDFPLLLNRVAFISKLKLLLNSGQPFRKGRCSIVWFDMDALKQINEKFPQITGGHGYLIAFSKALAKTIPKEKGFAAHIYGDEFLAFLPIPPDNVEGFLKRKFEVERIKQLKKWEFFNSAKKQSINLNYSAGILGINRHSSVEKALGFAQEQCRLAKMQGREKNTFSRSEYR